jgi:hypothetical protein
VDGSASGRGVPTFMVSGFSNAANWWVVDDSVGYDPQGPLRFIDIQPKAGAPLRGLGHVKLSWDKSQHSEVGKSLCGNGNNDPCPSLGFVRHAGKKFSEKHGLVGRIFGDKHGLAMTAVGEIVGPVNGYGWIVELNKGAPRNLRITAVEVLPETPLLISIAYPAGTTINMTANAASSCWNSTKNVTCTEVFTKAASLQEVRTGPGNQFFMDSNGVLTFRVIQPCQGYVGRPHWFIPSRTEMGRYERSGVYLPRQARGNYLQIDAACEGSDPYYCSGTPDKYDPDVCSNGYVQTAYDSCCSTANPSVCIYAGQS